MLDVAQQLGSDVAAALPEELRPLAVGPVGVLERLGVPYLVAEDERDHGAILGVRRAKVPAVSAEPVMEEQPPADDRAAYAGVLRFYELAKRQEWMVRDLAWGEIPLVPEGKGSPERQARRRDVWRSVVMQQLQADVLAVEMAAQLLRAAPEPEARPHYRTMVG